MRGELGLVVRFDRKDFCRQGCLGSWTRCDFSEIVDRPSTPALGHQIATLAVFRPQPAQSKPGSWLIITENDPRRFRDGCHLGKGRVVLTAEIESLIVISPDRLNLPVGRVVCTDSKNRSRDLNGQAFCVRRDGTQGVEAC